MEHSIKKESAAEDIVLLSKCEKENIVDTNPQWGSGGGLIRLVALGAQDPYITGDRKISLVESLNEMIKVLDKEVERWKYGSKIFDRIMNVQGNARALIMIFNTIGIKGLIGCKYWPAPNTIQECFYRSDQASRERLTTTLGMLNSALVWFKDQVRYL